MLEVNMIKDKTNIKVSDQSYEIGCHGAVGQATAFIRLSPKKNCIESVKKLVVY
jgi:hypothetical protein